MDSSSGSLDPASIPEEVAIHLQLAGLCTVDIPNWAYYMLLDYKQQPVLFMQETLSSGSVSISFDSLS